MGYDPNDPNQGSQAPGEDQSTADWQAKNATTTGTVNDLVRSRPAIAAWLAAHRNGQNLSGDEKSQLFTLMKQQGIDPTNLEVANDGTIAWPKHTGRDIAIASLLVFGPAVAAWAIPVASAAGASGGVEAGVTSGLGTTALPGAGTALVGPTVAGAGTTAATAGAGGAAVYGPAADEFVGPVAANGSAAYGPAGAAGGLSVTDALKYGLPTVGNVVSGLIQANATSNASDKQQAYLEEALAYQKEQDALNRQLAANKIQLEANRYATYSGNVAPFIANGTTSGNRMASLLGLPEGAPSAGGGPQGGASGAGSSQGVPVTPEITAKLTDYYKSLGLTPTGPGTGPTDLDYFARQIAATGGLTPGNTGYWFDPTNGRIGQEISKAGIKTTPTSAPPASAPPLGTAALGTQPQARTADQPVTLKAPDGSTKQVPSSQLSYWLGKGAQQVSA
jgi:hypothetical protein